jgi:methionyl-tRNA synthetase
LRYNLIKNMPEQRDSEFTWKGFQETNNNELVNNLANFINRVIVLVNKYYNGRLPVFDDSLTIKCSQNANIQTSYTAELKTIAAHLERIGQHIEQFEFRAALSAMMELSSAGNQLLQFNEPWKLVKTDEARVRVVMHLATQYVAALQIACRPFLPFTSDKIGALLRSVAILEEGEWKKAIATLSAGEMLLDNGHEIGQPAHLFARMDDALIEAQVEKLRLSNAKETQDTVIFTEVKVDYEEVKETIAFDDFTKLDLRTGTIVAAEKVKKADKLLHLTVNLGFEERSIVSGIAQFFTPEEVVGQQVVIVANLAPRKLRGVESQGMILMAENTDGELVFVSPKDGFGNGFVVR